MKTYKIVGMNTDTKDNVLGVSVISKKAFDRLSIENKEVIGIVFQKEKTDKKGVVIEPSFELLGVLEIGNEDKKVYSSNPKSFLYYIETSEGSFLKVVK